MALVSSTVTPQFRGSFMSFATALQQLSLSASAALGAWIVTTGDHGQLEHYGTAGLVSMVFTVAAVWICTRIPHGQAS